MSSQAAEELKNIVHNINLLMGEPEWIAHAPQTLMGLRDALAARAESLAGLLQPEAGVRNYYFDAEFIEDGLSIDLISIGIVSDRGGELYLCNKDCDLSRAGDWVCDNVLPHLPPPDDPAWQPQEEIADAIERFVELSPKPRFWSYYADYDWVALCQLFGKMIDLPSGFPMFCMDLKQYAVMLGDPRLPEQTTPEHHALNDAKWVHEAHTFLRFKEIELKQFWGHR